jgi:cob(I)alamin adenosyltransferase
MPIYTKKGDEGETGLFNAKKNEKRRVSKDSLRINAIGSIDELNSFLGICITFCDYKETTALLKEIQGNLLTIGSILAGSNLRFFASKTKKLEKVIDELDAKLPPLSNFILPGGSKLSAHLQYARSRARRAERNVVALNKVEVVRPQILTYLNRLSDFLFMLARDANFRSGIEDERWER